MMTYRIALSVLALALAASPAGAASSIVTTQPVQGVPYNSAPIRQNFQNAAGDITALQSLNAGATAPSSPESGELWLNTPQSSTLYTLEIWNARQSVWLPISSFDSLNNLWIPPVGGGLPVSLLADNTTDLGTVPNTVITITGPGPIYSFGSTSPAGILKVIQFTGTTQIVYNATSMILPGAADINTGAGDMVIATALGSGNWQVLFLQTSTLTVPQGGTGRAALTAHTVLVGAGTSPINFAGPGAAGVPLLGAGASADPTFTALDIGGAGVTGNLLVAHGGTGLTAATAHNLLVGAGTSALTLLAPGTAGLPVVSQGATLDPTYAILTVPGGGTGVATIAAHGVVLGEDAAAIAVASPGTSGLPLVSQGASSDPVFAALDLSAAVTGKLPLTDIANIANDTVLGNVSGISAAPTALTQTQLTTLVNPFTSSLSGAAPASGGGTTTFLRADGTWAAPSSTTYSASGGITLTGSNFALTPIADSTILGNVSGSSAIPSALTKTQVTTLVNAFSSSLSGAAPASGGGTSNFLRADGAWTAPTSVVGAQVFDTAGTYTFTIPSPSVKFTLVGAGGGSDGTYDGGAGGLGIVWYGLSLTAGNTITVTVGAGGATGVTGTNGGVTTLTSGTQTISTVTAGNGLGANGSVGGTGAGSGASINNLSNSAWIPYGSGAHITGNGSGGIVIAEW